MGKGVGMARQARVFIEEKDAGVYHLCSRVAGPKGWYPLSEAINQQKLQRCKKIFLKISTFYAIKGS